MARFSARRDMLGDQPIVVLSSGAGLEARIACHGAALLNLVVPRAGTPFDIAWGYRSAQEIVARAGSHFAILAPFGGRVTDARYRFDGHTYDLQPGVIGDARGFRHGFVRDADFSVAELAADDASASATLATGAIRPRPGYPFSIDLGVCFTLRDTGLELEARMRNVGAHAAPCFFGWHAYFRVGDGRVDDWTLRIPARDAIRTDTKLLPLPGPAAFAPLETLPALDFRHARRVGATLLDAGYAQLAVAPDGCRHTQLDDPATGFGLDVWQERGVMHAFTGDSLGAGARSAIALEPMECMADAFNRPECAQAIRLEPGVERCYRCGVAWTRARSGP